MFDDDASDPLNELDDNSSLKVDLPGHKRSNQISLADSKNGDQLKIVPVNSEMTLKEALSDQE